MAYDRTDTGTWVWLKSVGTQEEPLQQDWMMRDRHLLTRVWFSKHPRSIREGDILVYYASGHGVLPALMRVVSDAVDEDLTEDRWKWCMHVRPVVTLSLEDAPSIYDTPINPLSVRRQSHIRVVPSDYEAIRTLIMNEASNMTHPAAA